MKFATVSLRDIIYHGKLLIQHVGRLSLGFWGGGIVQMMTFSPSIKNSQQVPLSEMKSQKYYVSSLLECEDAIMCAILPLQDQEGDGQYGG
jgi:hypothetical protein